MIRRFSSAAPSSSSNFRSPSSGYRMPTPEELIPRGSPEIEYRYQKMREKLLEEKNSLSGNFGGRRRRFRMRKSRKLRKTRKNKSRRRM